VSSNTSTETLNHIVSRGQQVNTSKISIRNLSVDLTHLVTDLTTNTQTIFLSSLKEELFIKKNSHPHITNDYIVPFINSSNYNEIVPNSITSKTTKSNILIPRFLDSKFANLNLRNNLVRMRFLDERSISLAGCFYTTDASLAGGKDHSIDSRQVLLSFAKNKFK
jgi:hypothetical protein